jgi:hypothetical protein
MAGDALVARWCDPKRFGDAVARSPASHGRVVVRRGLVTQSSVFVPIDDCGQVEFVSALR